MSLELLSTIGTLLTVLIVGATAIATLLQLRHLRAGNQINAILTIGDKFLEPRHQEANLLHKHHRPYQSSRIAGLHPHRS